MVKTAAGRGRCSIRSPPRMPTTCRSRAFEHTPAPCAGCITILQYTQLDPESWRVVRVEVRLRRWWDSAVTQQDEGAAACVDYQRTFRSDGGKRSEWITGAVARIRTRNQAHARRNCSISILADIPRRRCSRGTRDPYGHDSTSASVRRPQSVICKFASSARTRPAQAGSRRDRTWMRAFL